MCQPNKKTVTSHYEHCHIILIVPWSNEKSNKIRLRVVVLRDEHLVLKFFVRRSVIKYCCDVIHVNYTITRGSQSLQNLVAISQGYCQPVVTLNTGYKGNNGKNWLLSPGTSSQSEGYSSKWLIWLVCRESLHYSINYHSKYTVDLIYKQCYTSIQDVSNAYL